jgi:hypothetical protein
VFIEPPSLFRICFGEIFKAFGESVAAGKSEPASLGSEKFGLDCRIIGRVGSRKRKTFGSFDWLTTSAR